MDINDLEALRKKCLTIVLIFIGIGVIAGVSLFIVDAGFWLLSIFMPILCGMLGFFVTKNARYDFESNYKDAFVRKALQETFDNLNYEPDNGLDPKVIGDTHMMRMGMYYHSNDYVSGAYKGINIEQADVHIEDETVVTDRDGHVHTETYTLFKGRWMVFDFNKSFKANIQVRDKHFANSKLGNFWSDEHYQKIELEDEEFNKMFRVNAQSEHDAFYVLTPSLMERMKDLRNSVNGRIIFCFVDDKLHVGVSNNKDSFEHSIFKPINVEEETNKIGNDIKLITDFADGLNLENDLFK